MRLVLCTDVKQLKIGSEICGCPEPKMALNRAESTGIIHEESGNLKR